MIKNVPLSFVFSIIALLSLSSCDGDTSRERIVQNSSSGPITIIVEIDGVDDIIETIQTNESKSLFISSQLGGSDFVEHPSNGISNMLITNSANDTLKKDYTIQDNWIIKVEQTRKVPSIYKHTYIFNVKDEDF